MATLSLFSVCGDAGAWSVLEILGTLSLFSARRDAGAWSVLEFVAVSGDLLVVKGVSRPWHVERPRILHSNEDLLVVLHALRSFQQFSSC